MKKSIVSILFFFVVVMVAVVIARWLDGSLNKIQADKEGKIEDKVSRYYVKGANDALDAFTLLILEQKLQGTNRMCGEMSDIVRSRLGIPLQNTFPKKEAVGLGAVEKRIDELEKKLANLEKLNGNIAIKPGMAVQGEYVLPLTDSTGGVTELHIPIYTNSPVLLQYNGVKTIPLGGQR